MVQKRECHYFDTPMGSFDGAGICELIGRFLHHSVNNKIDPNNHGLYHNDGLIIVDTQKVWRD